MAWDRHISRRRVPLVAVVVAVAVLAGLIYGFERSSRRSLDEVKEAVESGFSAAEAALSLPRVDQTSIERDVTQCGSIDWFGRNLRSYSIQAAHDLTPGEQERVLAKASSLASSDPYTASGSYGWSMGGAALTVVVHADGLLRLDAVSGCIALEG